MEILINDFDKVSGAYCVEKCALFVFCNEKSTSRVLGLATTRALIGDYPCNKTD